ncbi:hypothetical protein RhiLY_12677 [Ceratobasidium sp. AG-Ba]|nr:hypothetical protein RhiLY_12677 [Ceratobasidium sp. AG-Ba]
MTKKTKSATKHGVGNTPTFNASTYTGLAVESDGTEPIIRHKTPALSSLCKSKRRDARETLGKVKNDMERRVLFCVKQAIDNKVVLPFRMRDLQTRRDQGEIRLSTDVGCLSELAGRGGTRLKAKDGCRVVVDSNGIVVFWYFPRLIGTGLQTELLRAISAMTGVYLPPLDSRIADRRSTPSVPVITSQGVHQSTGPLTRRQTALNRAVQSTVSLGKPTDVTTGFEANEESDNSDGDLASIPRTLCYDNIPETTSPTRYLETDDEVHLLDSDAEHHALLTAVEPIKQHSQSVAQDDDLRRVPPFAYNLTPGWFPTGQQYICPIAMSSHFKDALAPHCRAETIKFLEAKRLFDGQLGYLTNIIHHQLANEMRGLRASMSTVVGPTGVAVANGWTSAFPCYTVAVNRTSQLHRDSKGIRAGMDIIGVLGKFTKGGDLCLPDIDMEVEWIPGCVGAFDGYDLRHSVKPWEGGSRVALISYCRKSTWSGLELEVALTRPTLPEVEVRLGLATRVRQETIVRHLDERSKSNKTVPSQEDLQNKHRTLVPETRATLFKEGSQVGGSACVVHRSTTLKRVGNPELQSAQVLRQKLSHTYKDMFGVDTLTGQFRGIKRMVTPWEALGNDGDLEGSLQAILSLYGIQPPPPSPISPSLRSHANAGFQGIIFRRAYACKLTDSGLNPRCNPWAQHWSTTK